VNTSLHCPFVSLDDSANLEFINGSVGMAFYSYDVSDGIMYLAVIPSQEMAVPPRSLSFLSSMPIPFRTVDDRVMGGRSQSAMVHSAELPAGVFSGELSAPFCAACVQADVNWNLSAVSKVRVVAASSTGGVSKFRLHDTNSLNPAVHQQDFAVEGGGEFRAHELPLDLFRGTWRGRDKPDASLNRSNVVVIGLIMAKVNETGPFFTVCEKRLRSSERIVKSARGQSSYSHVLSAGFLSLLGSESMARVLAEGGGGERKGLGNFQLHF
jgi:hypothetical protein